MAVTGDEQAWENIEVVESSVWVKLDERLRDLPMVGLELQRHCCDEDGHAEIVT